MVADGNALTQLVSAQGETEVDRSASDLDAALAAARAELAPGHVPRLVLFSDGRATTGDIAAAVTQLAAAGIPVHVFPLAPRDLGDTWVEALRLPTRLAPGGLIAATVDVGSQKLTGAVVEIRNGDKVLGTKTVTLTPGTTPVVVDVSVDEAGAVTLEASVTAVGDPLADNNRLTQAAWVAPRPRVLYVEGTPASSKYLTAALEQSGFDVAVRPQRVCRPAPRI